jgi:spore coat protein U-like protein
MESWKIAAMFAILAVTSLFAISAVRAYTNSSDITAQVTVPAVCTVSLSANSIDFGSVAPGTDTGSNNQQVTVTNGGNTEATNVTIKGNDWSGPDTMPVGQTQWATSAFTYGSGNALTASDAVVTTNLAAGSSTTLYFGVGVPSGQAAGTYTQTITVTMNC